MRLRRAAAVMLCGLLTVACGGGRGNQTASSGVAASTPAPVRGGTLVAALDADPGHLNPAITTSGATHTASELIYNGLVGLGPNLEPTPELAEKWQVEENGTVYRFSLRKGVAWHDGSPFTSADVKYSFESVLLKLHARTKASVGPVLQSIETPDDATVVFRFKQPYAPFLQQLDVTEAPIVAKHVYEGTDPQNNPANQAPVGTGPFKFVSYTPGSEVRLARNPSYFKQDLPYLDAVVLRVIPDKATQVAALEKGEVDWLFGAPGPDLQRLRTRSDLGFLQTGVNPGGSNCTMTVSFNLDRPLLQDLRVRQAFAHALDRSVFLDRVLFGEGAVAEAPISSGIASAQAKGLEVPKFDRSTAARLLDEAGWKQAGSGTRTATGVNGVPDGTPLAIDFLHFPSFSQYGELFRTQLAAVGVGVTLRPLEPPVFADTVFKQRNFDTNIISYCNGTDPEIGVRRMYTSANIGPVPFSNSSAYRNPQVDALFDKARATVDAAARTEVYRQIQQILLKDLPYLWIVETRSTRVHVAACQGFSASGHFAETAFCRR